MGRVELELYAIRAYFLEEMHLGGFSITNVCQYMYNHTDCNKLILSYILVKMKPPVDPVDFSPLNVIKGKKNMDEGIPIS